MNELLDAGHSVSDVEKRIILLRGVRRELEAIAKVVRMSGQTVTEAVAHLIIEKSSQAQEDLNESASTTSNERHSTHGQNSAECFNCGKNGHVVRECLREKECYHCSKKRHLSKVCWSNPDVKAYRGELRNGQRNKGSKQQAQNFKPEREEEHAMMTVCTGLICSDMSLTKDNGCLTRVLRTTYATVRCSLRHFNLNLVGSKLVTVN